MEERKKPKDTATFRKPKTRKPAQFLKSVENNYGGDTPETYAENKVEGVSKALWEARPSISLQNYLGGRMKQEALAKKAKEGEAVSKKLGEKLAKLGKALGEAAKKFVASLAEGGILPIAILLIILLLFASLMSVASESGETEELVMVAKSQVGNVGGKPYWSWYGYKEHVEWCACFVSWCGNQCGYLETERLPKFAGCEQGALWFQERGCFLPGGVEPKPGMLVFFDWEKDGNDGQPDHVGIVTEVKENTFCTVEGNVDDECRQKVYSVDNPAILGFGVVRKWETIVFE